MARSGIRALAALAAAGSLLSGCAVIQSLLPAAEVQVPGPGTLEPVQAAAVARDQAVFWVSSNGCTTRDDLTPVVSQYRGASTITLWRTGEDACDQPVPGGVEVRWTFEEMGLPPGTPVRVGNPSQLPRG
jgi:hypothetical protein